MSDLARRFLDLFEGSGEAHGTYSPGGTSITAGKIEIKSSARTVRGAATEDLWDQHLRGENPLGIIALRQDDTIVWACGDVDKYDLIHGSLAGEIHRAGLPLLVCRSKSGGGHVFLFLREPADPLKIQDWMRAQMARLGHGGCEIFPKQNKILRDRGDVGNWIVMPYFGDTQAAVRPGGGEMTAEEFVRSAEALRVDPALLETGTRRANGHKHETALLMDGPPCLEHLVHAGFPEGTRNKGLFAIGVYCKKRWPDNWQTKLEEFNQSSMRPPLPSDEVVIVVKSLEKKEYNYTCKDIPLVSHCNAPLCHTRLYGVAGGRGDIPIISGLAVLETDPPIWFLDIDSDRLELSTDELLNYKLFHKRCTEKLLKVFHPIRAGAWVDMVGTAMETVSRIEVSVEVGAGGRFYEVLEEFCTNRTVGTRPEDLFSKRVYHSAEERRYYFRLQDLERMVERANMTPRLSRGQIVSKVRDMHGGKKFLLIKHKGTNTWFVPDNVFSADPKVDPAPLEREVM